MLSGLRPSIRAEMEGRRKLLRMRLRTRHRIWWSEVEISAFQRPRKVDEQISVSKHHLYADCGANNGGVTEGLLRHCGAKVGILLGRLRREGFRKP
ncbi:hypothetical protein EPI10_002321 [Gossypium australe]|uniref:Uncharacterized protein n=1 Tax=Gossypium australe TaxID=47621 RepID=A0A5B6VE22_9ROSI|nr:hypothetical protein EPI10_002321 [Gossypium australe]